MSRGKNTLLGAHTEEYLDHVLTHFSGQTRDLILGTTHLLPNRISLAEMMVSVQMWLKRHEKNLRLVNPGREIDKERIIQEYLLFLKSLRNKNLHDSGPQSKYWGWFAESKRCSYSLDLSESNVIQHIELDRAAQRQRREVNSIRHIPLDMSDPEEIARFLGGR